MRAMTFTWTRSATVLTLTLILGLPACEEIEVPAIQIPPASGDGAGAPRKNDCFSHVMFLVEGDAFTMLSAGSESFDTRGTVRDETGYGWNPEIEPRAKCKADLDKVRGKYKGYARLLWDDAVVQEVALDNDFAFGTEPEILAYEAPDGTRVELHAFAQPECTIRYLDGVMTRAEVEALGR